MEPKRSPMPALDVGRLVGRAVEADRFWVFTDMEMVAATEARVHAVLAAENPPAMPGITRD